MPDQQDLLTVDASETANDRGIVSEGAITRQRHEILGDTRDIMLKCGSLGMPCNLGLLPRRQLGIGFLQQFGRFGLQFGNLRARYRFLPAFAVSRNSLIRWSSAAIGFFEVEVGQHRGAG
jgi:hypothetical protein